MQCAGDDDDIDDSFVRQVRQNLRLLTVLGGSKRNLLVSASVSFNQE